MRQSCGRTGARRKFLGACAIVVLCVALPACAKWHDKIAELKAPNARTQQEGGKVNKFAGLSLIE